MVNCFNQRWVVGAAFAAVPATGIMRVCAQKSRLPASAVKPKLPRPGVRGCPCHSPVPSAAPFSHCKPMIFQLDSRKGKKKSFMIKSIT